MVTELTTGWSDRALTLAIILKSESQGCLAAHGEAQDACRPCKCQRVNTNYTIHKAPHMVLWARPMGTIKILQHRARSAQKCYGLHDTGGWQHSEVIMANCGNKEPEGKAIMEQNKSSCNAGEKELQVNAVLWWSSSPINISLKKSIEFIFSRINCGFFFFVTCRNYF